MFSPMWELEMIFFQFTQHLVLHLCLFHIPSFSPIFTSCSNKNLPWIKLEHVKTFLCECLMILLRLQTFIYVLWTINLGYLVAICTQRVIDENYTVNLLIVIALHYWQLLLPSSRKKISCTNCISRPISN
jgi:hypothetical protein